MRLNNQGILTRKGVLMVILSPVFSVFGKTKYKISGLTESSLKHAGIPFTMKLRLSSAARSSSVALKNYLLPLMTDSFP